MSEHNESNKPANAHSHTLTHTHYTNNASPAAIMSAHNVSNKPTHAHSLTHTLYKNSASEQKLN